MFYYHKYSGGNTVDAGYTLWILRGVMTKEGGGMVPDENREV